MIVRRDFLKFMGRTAAMAGAMPWITPLEWAHAAGISAKGAPFKPLAHNTLDKLSLIDGLSYDVLLKWKDPINSKDLFGTHNDFLAFQPFEGQTSEGVLLVNHEYFDPVLFHGRNILGSPRAEEDVRKEMAAVGNSLVHIKKVNGKWMMIPNSIYNRRISAETVIPFQKGYSIQGATQAVGTLANCAGGQTPWKTFLTCEENFNEFYGDVTYIDRKREFIKYDKYNWYEKFSRPPEHYGWVVEINPLTGEAVKRCAMGRFEHESACVVMGRSGRVVVYMGEDRKGGYLYKFMADRKNSLETGTLYVADTVNGRWIPLDIEKTPVLKKHFDSQLDILTYARRASEVAGGTPQDRPEDIERDPIEGSIYISLTNNMDKNNLYGGIFKLTEKNGDHEGLEFTSKMWLPGSQEIGFACPDNLVFDNKGNLWMTNDVAIHDLNDGKYGKIGNNGLFFIPLRGPQAGKAFLVATSPVGSEFTGPMFSPDFKTLFLSVQHPGEDSKDASKPTSTWPEGPGHEPKSSVVTIHGPLLDRITT